MHLGSELELEKNTWNLLLLDHRFYSLQKHGKDLGYDSAILGMLFDFLFKIEMKVVMHLVDVFSATNQCFIFNSSPLRQ